MTGPNEPFNAPELIATLAAVSRHQGQLEDAELLDAAVPSLIESGYDNWNGGTYFYSIVLDLPPALYARIEPDLHRTEKRLYDRLKPLTRPDEGASLSEILLRTRLKVPRPLGQSPAEPALDPALDRLWIPGAFRLFLSHVSLIKAQTHGLKKALTPYGICAFVAHDDVAPTLSWQDEIEQALRSMDALAALVTPEFCNSKWCDQEVGFALGSGKLVIPVRVGADPHGFIGRHQGVQAKSKKASQLADELFLILVNHPQSRDRYVHVLVERLESSGSWSASKEIVGLIERVKHVDESALVRLEASVESNTEVGRAFGVPDRITAICRKHRETHSGE